MRSLPVSPCAIFRSKPRKLMACGFRFTEVLLQSVFLKKHYRKEAKVPPTMKPRSQTPIKIFFPKWKHLIF